MRFEGKVAVVTGAAAGFGEAIAHRFAAEGAKLVLVDLREQACTDVAESIANTHDRGVEIVIGDVASKETHSQACRRAIEVFGDLSFWVNNAALAQHNKSFRDIDEDECDRLFAVNVRSILYAAQVIVESAQQASIVNVSSAVGMRPRPGLSVYNATKAAVNNLTKGLALELAAENIRVNAVCPTLGETGLLPVFTGIEDTPENRQALARIVPLGRLTKPHDVANAVVFLASDEAEFITGVTLEVDGGRTL